MDVCRLTDESHYTERNNVAVGAAGILNIVVHVAWGLPWKAPLVIVGLALLASYTTVFAVSLAYWLSFGSHRRETSTRPSCLSHNNAYDDSDGGLRQKWETITMEDRPGPCTWVGLDPEVMRQYI